MDYPHWKTTWITPPKDSSPELHQEIFPYKMRFWCHLPIPTWELPGISLSSPSALPWPEQRQQQLLQLLIKMQQGEGAEVAPWNRSSKRTFWGLINF